MINELLYTTAAFRNTSAHVLIQQRTQFRGEGEREIISCPTAITVLQQCDAK